MANWQKYEEEHKQLWESMVIIRDVEELTRLSAKIIEFKDVYQKVEDEIGVPWQMVAVIHVREAGEQDIGRWRCVLHNGEKIVGTGKKTTLVPKNQGPFYTWHQAAIHALKQKKFHEVQEWNPALIISALEPYNGYGYRNKGIRSPYLWASTNHQEKGKYVADGKFNPNVWDTQIGCAALLKYLGVQYPTTPEEEMTWIAGATMIGSTVGLLATPARNWPIVGGATALALLIGAIWAYRRWIKDKLSPEQKEEIRFRVKKKIEERLSPKEPETVVLEAEKQIITGEKKPG